MFPVARFTSPRIQSLIHALNERIVIIDGAMGTMIQDYNLDEEDYRGGIFKTHPSDLRGNNDLLNLTRPDIIEAIHRAYLVEFRRHRPLDALWLSAPCGPRRAFDASQPIISLSKRRG